MSIISLASDLSKILAEQISILNSISSLKSSLKKLLAQKELPEKWDESDITLQPKALFFEVIDSKAAMIQDELKKLRYLLQMSELLDNFI